MSHPRRKAKLRCLQRLTVLQPAFVPRDSRICRWLCKLISAAPLRELRLYSTEARTPPFIRLNGLTQHILVKHTSTLRVLQLSSVYMHMRDVINLCRQCTALEVLCIGISVAAQVRGFLLLYAQIPLTSTSSPHQSRMNKIFSLCTRLQTLAVFVPDLQWNRAKYDANDAAELMSIMPCLRQLTMQDRQWKV